MPQRSLTLNVSLTETGPFKRLVTFLTDVEQLADDRCDLELRELVERARDDLLTIRDGDA